MKKILCTILLGSALIADSAWASTDVAVPVSVGIRTPAATTAEKPKTSDYISREQIEDQLDELYKKYPRPIENLPTFNAYRISSEMDRLIELTDKARAENRKQYTEEEQIEVNRIQRKVTQEVKNWYPDYIKASRQHYQAIKQWRAAHPDIVKLEELYILS